MLGVGGGVTRMWAVKDVLFNRIAVVEEYGMVFF